MDPEARERLVDHFAAMAADGPAAAFAFLGDFGDTLAAVVRGHLRDLHRGDLAADPDEVDGLVIDVALELAARAGSWDPAGGALPWTWAHRAVRACIVAGIGNARVEVEIDDLDLGGAGPGLDGPYDGPGVDGPYDGPYDGPELGGPARHELDDLAARHPEIALLQAVVAEAVGSGPTSARNRDLYLEYRLQKQLGDPSPAETLAGQLAVTPDNIRQIHSRTHRKVQVLVATDPRYRPLRGLGWMAS